MYHISYILNFTFFVSVCLFFNFINIENTDATIIEYNFDDSNTSHLKNTYQNIFIKSGGIYSNSSIEIEKNLSSDGSYLAVPSNAIMELKFPDVDIVGKAR